MKKVLTALFCLVLLVALASSLVVTTSADEPEITIGQSYAWNNQAVDANAEKAWRLGGGVSPDKNWTYKVCVLATGKYLPVVISSAAGGYAWAASPGDTGIGFARVRYAGVNFHPAEAADIVKVFTCPSGGTITLDTTVARSTEFDPTSSGTPTSFAVYICDGIDGKKLPVNKEKIYPVDDGYVTLTSAEEKNISIPDIEVAKGQMIMIHIGAIEGNQASDAVNMSNTITYTGISDGEIDPDSISTEDGKPSVPTRDSIGTLKPAGGSQTTTTTAPVEDSGSLGLIIGIVAGAVVAAAVVVVILLKKKKSE